MTGTLSDQHDRYLVATFPNPETKKSCKVTHAVGIKLTLTSQQQLWRLKDHGLCWEIMAALFRGRVASHLELNL